MSDITTMMRGSLQTQLDAAVTAGNTEAARKISDDLAKLAISTAPKTPPYGQAEITAELDKQAWFGTDPRKSAKAVELGKTMDPKKFPTAAAFTEALVKAVDEEFKPASTAKEPPENETDEEREAREQEEADAAEAKKPKRTDAPGEGDAGSRTNTRRNAGPWTKLSDAPTAVQADIKRTADKFAPKTKEGRENYITRALSSHYEQAQRAKGKK